MNEPLVDINDWDICRLHAQIPRSGIPIPGLMAVCAEGENFGQFNLPMMELKVLSPDGRYERWLRFVKRQP